jgi:pantoate--beta-alanine ligase
MGALHEGHASLIRAGVAMAQARELPGGCVVSIFVNPTQFDDRADYDRYPRDLDEDLKVCDSAGAACVFAPREEDIYPPDEKVEAPRLPDVATKPGLEDAQRPGHFGGVCQVVKRLFDLVRPVAAIFGDKDWQQLQVIRAMAKDLRLPVEVLGAPTIRDADGLAMSSRNRFLAPQDREQAQAIPRALRQALGAANPEAAEEIMRLVLTESAINPEYAVVREASTLLRPTDITPATQWRSLIAARVGSVRLIDNAPWQPRAFGVTGSREA